MLRDEFRDAASKSVSAQVLAAINGVTQDGFSGIIMTSFDSPDGTTTYVVVRNYKPITGRRCRFESSSKREMFLWATSWAWKEQLFN